MVKSKILATLDKTNSTRRPVPAICFNDIKTHILGPKYFLSLVFIGDRRGQTLNKKYKNKNTPTNILSFPLSNDCGEVFINLARAKREAPKFDMTYRVYVAYLFIHGCFHLKGYAHGSTMENKEKKVLNSFVINEQKHRHRS